MNIYLKCEIKISRHESYVRMQLRKLPELRLKNNKSTGFVMLRGTFMTPVTFFLRLESTKLLASQKQEIEKPKAPKILFPSIVQDDGVLFLSGLSAFVLRRA